MTDDNKAFYTAVAVAAAAALVALVAVAVFVHHSNEKGREYDGYAGKYFVYDVSGSSGSATFDGTMRIEIKEVKGSTATVAYTYDIYRTISGSRTPYLVSVLTETADLSKDDDLGIWKRYETMSTKWGYKTVDVYLKASGGSTYEWYVSRVDHNVAYKMITTEGGVTLTYTLSKTNHF